MRLAGFFVVQLVPLFPVQLLARVSFLYSIQMATLVVSPNSPNRGESDEVYDWLTGYMIGSAAVLIGEWDI